MQLCQYIGRSHVEVQGLPVAEMCVGEGLQTDRHMFLWQLHCRMLYHAVCKLRPTAVVAAVAGPQVAQPACAGRAHPGLRHVLSYGGVTIWTFGHRVFMTRVSVCANDCR